MKRNHINVWIPKPFTNDFVKKSYIENHNFEIKPGQVMYTTTPGAFDNLPWGDDAPSNAGLKITIAALVVSNLLAVYMIVDYRAQVRGFDGFIQAQLDSAARVQGMEVVE